MNENNRLFRSFAVIAKITVVSTVIGAAIGAFRAEPDTATGEVLIGALTGTIIGFGCSLSEHFVFSNPYLKAVRRFPPIGVGFLRAVSFGLIILLGLSAPRLATDGLMPWKDPQFAEVFFISVCVAAVMSIGIEITRLLGSEAMLALVTGRYNRPRLEERVVMFADLIGSTRLAERLGELEFHVFLQEVALDLADPIEGARGNVHRYVGDAVIVTWPLKSGTERATCLACALKMHQVLFKRADRYRRQFNTEPRLRIALHCGQVAAGEIGDWKKEIALLGDTMNTAARIESAAKDLDETTVISDTLAQKLPHEARANLRHLPPYSAAGKREDLVLWAADDPS